MITIAHTEIVNELFHAPARLEITLHVYRTRATSSSGQGMVKRTALDTVQSSHTGLEMNWTLGVNRAQAWIRSPSVSTS